MSCCVTSENIFCPTFLAISHFLFLLQLYFVKLIYYWYVYVFSLLLQQSAELLQRAVHCPGFLHTAVLCYIGLLQLFLEGRTPTPTAEPSEKQVTDPQVIVCTICKCWTALKSVTLL